MKIDHQNLPINFDRLTTTRVRKGSCPPRPSKRVAKTGITFHKMTYTTTIAMVTTETG